jgi:hypothetical protein
LPATIIKAELFTEAARQVRLKKGPKKREANPHEVFWLLLQKQVAIFVSFCAKILFKISLKFTQKNIATCIVYTVSEV